MAKKKQTQKPVDAPPAAAGTTLSPRWWWAGCVFVTAVAAFFRLFKLGLKPFHHDEGVNGFFMTRLVREGIYQYNPQDYHGPTLYYFAVPLVKLFGLNAISLRLVPALFGIATVILLLCFRRYIGAAGALSAALLLAVAPGPIFISRYFIHETMFVCFTVIIVLAALHWYRTTNIAYLITLTVSAALLFASKETAFISIGVLVIAGFAVLLADLVLAPERSDRGGRGWSKFTERTTEFVDRLGGPTGLAIQLVSALSAFVIVYVVFYSSFFTHRSGVSDSFAAFKLWSKTGRTDHTTNGWYAYLWWLRSSESPLFVLGALGAIFTAWVRRNRVAMFICLWAWGLFAAYTLVPYKTPWLAINFVVPLALCSGIAIDFLLRYPDKRDGRILAGLLLGGSLVFCIYSAIQLNFYHYDDDRYPYIYAHSKRQMLQLVNAINQVAREAGTGPATGIIITSQDYWPLPWYLRDYTRVGYSSQVTPPGNSEMMIGRSDQREELDALLLTRYRYAGEYALRPGVDLLLYVRSDLALPPAPAPSPQP